MREKSYGPFWRLTAQETVSSAIMSIIIIPTALTILIPDALSMRGFWRSTKWREAMNDHKTLAIHVKIHWGPEYIFRGFSSIEETEKGDLIIWYGKKKIRFSKRKDKSSFEWELII